MLLLLFFLSKVPFSLSYILLPGTNPEGHLPPQLVVKDFIAQLLYSKKGVKRCRVELKKKNFNTLTLFPLLLPGISL